MRQPLLAVQPGGDGKRPREDIVWQIRPGHVRQPHAGRLGGHLLFMVTNDGVARCLDATPAGCTGRSV